VASNQAFRVPLGKDIILASVVSNVLALALPLVLLQIYDRIIPNNGLHTLVALAIGLLVAIILDVCVRNARAAILDHIGLHFERHLAERTINTLLASDLSHVEKEQPGAHLDRLNAIDKIRDFRTGEAATAYLEIPFIFIFLGTIALISPILAGLIAIIAAAAVLLGRKLEAQAHACISQRRDLDMRRQSFLIEVLRSIEAVKSMGIEDFMERRYERLMGTSATVGARSSMLAQVSGGFAGSVMQLATVLVAGIGAIFVIQKSMTVGALAAVILLTGRVLQPIFRLETMRGKARELAIWEERLAQFITAPRRVSGFIDPGSLHKLALKDMTFAPEGSEKPVLDQISLCLKRGECIAINGVSGAGKSTLLSLIVGALLPTSGDITLNDVPMTACDPKFWRKRIALLAQTHTLLEGTVIENLTRFDAYDHMADALRLSDAMGLDQFFAQHPQGLSMPLRAGSSGLPASVVDRISIIRALVGQPDIILFDETNLSLDQDADERLHQYLMEKKQDVMLVIVSRSERYLTLADRHYTLTEGRLARTDAKEKSFRPVSSSSPHTLKMGGAA
jgi:ATP-binding cassette, subfamily C, bacterial LapB